MDFAGAGVALVIGADKMILAVVFVGIAGAEMAAWPRSRRSRAGRRKCWFFLFLSACVCSSEVPVPFPLSLLNDGGLGILKNTLVLNRVFPSAFEFQGLGIGLEVHGTAVYSRRSKF